MPGPYSAQRLKPYFHPGLTQTCPRRAGRPQLLTCGYSGPCQLVALERTTLDALSLQKLQDLATDLPYVATATRQVQRAAWPMVFHSCDCDPPAYPRTSRCLWW